MSLLSNFFARLRKFPRLVKADVVWLFLCDRRGEFVIKILGIELELVIDLTFACHLIGHLFGKFRVELWSQRCSNQVFCFLLSALSDLVPATLMSLVKGVELGFELNVRVNSVNRLFADFVESVVSVFHSNIICV